METSYFLQKAENQIRDNDYLFNQYRQITVQDVEEAGCPIDELTGLEFHIVIYYRCFPEAHVRVDFLKNGEKLWNGFSLNENFSKEQIHYKSSPSCLFK